MNQTVPSTPSIRLAFVGASWHGDIVDQGLRGMLSALAERGIARHQVDVHAVAGAFEIPLHAKRLAQSGLYDGIVACAFVVDGGIYRHEFVSSAVIDGLMRVQLDTDVPVFSVVLTPKDFHGHEEHTGFFREHFVKKGEEVAKAAVQTIESLRAMAAQLAR